MHSWKKWNDEVNSGSGSATAKGGTERMLASAAMRAVNAMVLAFTMFYCSRSVAQLCCPLETFDEIGI